MYICNECIELSATLVEDSARSTPEESSQRRSQYYDRPTDDILAQLPALFRSAERVEGELARWIHHLRERGCNWQTIAGVAGVSVDVARRRFDYSPSK